MANADVITVHINDDAQKLALEQLHEVLSHDAAIVRQHLGRAQEADAIGRRKYANGLSRLVKSVKPDLELPAEYVIKGDTDKHTITIEPKVTEPPAKPKVKKGGKAK